MMKSFNIYITLLVAFGLFSCTNRSTFVKNSNVSKPSVCINDSCREFEYDTIFIDEKNLFHEFVVKKNNLQTRELKIIIPTEYSYPVFLQNKSFVLPFYMLSGSEIGGKFDKIPYIVQGDINLDSAEVQRLKLFKEPLSENLINYLGKPSVESIMQRKDEEVSNGEFSLHDMTDEVQDFILVPSNKGAVVISKILAPYPLANRKSNIYLVYILTHTGQLLIPDQELFSGQITGVWQHENQYRFPQRWRPGPSKRDRLYMTHLLEAGMLKDTSTVVVPQFIFFNDDQSWFYNQLGSVVYVNEGESHFYSHHLLDRVNGKMVSYTYENNVFTCNIESHELTVNLPDFQDNSLFVVLEDDILYLFGYIPPMEENGKVYDGKLMAAYIDPVNKKTAQKLISSPFKAAYIPYVLGGEIYIFEETKHPDRFIAGWTESTARTKWDLKSETKKIILPFFEINLDK